MYNVYCINDIFLMKYIYALYCSNTVERKKYNNIYNYEILVGFKN